MKFLTMIGFSLVAIVLFSCFLFGTPYVKSWALGISFVVIVTAIGTSFSILIVYVINRDKNPLWLVIIGWLVASLLSIGVLLGSLWIIVPDIENCYSQGGTLTSVESDNTFTKPRIPNSNIRCVGPDGKHLLY